MPSLSEKLRMIDSSAKKTPVEPQKAATDCYRYSERFPLSSFCELRHTTSSVLEEIFHQPFPKGVKPTDMLFLDTETTGLSGGAGTIAFEVGVGYLSDGRFVVEQFMLRDYPEEAFLLEHVAKLLEAFPVVVTFNGRTFDVPLLRSRLLMNRMSDRCIPDCHADVLHPARRLWKLRLGRCTLQRLEEAVLGVHREDDLPGALVPQTFFRFLENGDFYPMQKILEHNRQDVVSLAQLMFYLCMLYDRPEELSQPLDLFAMAKAAEKFGQADRARKCFRMAAKDELRSDAFLALARQERRAGNTPTCVKLYETMLERGDDPVDACEGLAKLYEHRLRNPAQALIYTRQALLILAEPRLRDDEAVQSRRNALQYRYVRLRRKCAGGTQA